MLPSGQHPYVDVLQVEATAGFSSPLGGAAVVVVSSWHPLLLGPFAAVVLSLQQPNLRYANI